MANFLTDKLARMGFLRWNPSTGMVATPQGERSLLLGQADPVTGKVINTIAVVTQAQYDALGTKLDTTLYVIVG